ncbi:MAG: ammonia channel protein [Candidatus Staskawiczbacteria bacterium RIFCSPHIGHO2_12_FULL_38_11]|uniref:Ammonium transporter n=1 Tax=Candidatus Staskawiczbacteria bacterium RIFCSPHIGHO2_12_FULL_38_11 TaxID=1802209 RepID=A0A1G2I6B1_9BACT|nr:MAG: ammonia channel protein [Candidatus Staskawiczbacteria bacterium RIFCSPHIGHO2_12_FULL_38_11]
MNSGDVAWVSAAATLVMLMTPALGFFYAGLVRRKNLVSTLVQCLAIFAVVTLVWTLWGYSLAFGPAGISGFVGNLSHFGLKGVGVEPNPDYAATIPALLFFFFQLKFAAITPALIIGAFAERIRFKALLIFIIFWVTIIYAPLAYWVWNTDGWLRAMGALDFAGGTVVHIAAGFSAIAAALVIGKRKDAQNGAEFKPNNIPFVILGAALLWFGWFGFNAGSALAANGLAVSALVVTNLAAAAGAVSWMMVDWVKKGRPSAVGISIGAVCGLVAITPASGFVGVIPAIIIGLVAGLLSNLVANFRARTSLDDSLDVFACHGVSGLWGALATGLFASVAVNSAGANGLFYGNPKLFGIQIVASLAVAAFAFIGTYVLLRLIDRFIIKLRISSKDEDIGLDVSQHGEDAYGELA